MKGLEGVIPEYGYLEAARQILVQSSPHFYLGRALEKGDMTPWEARAVCLGYGVLGLALELYEEAQDIQSSSGNCAFCLGHEKHHEWCVVGRFAARLKEEVDKQS
jgi:hypothetical protein